MSWSINNAAHRYLWIFCRSLHIDFALKGETLVSFDEGGDWFNFFIIDAAPGSDVSTVRKRAEIFSDKFNAWMLIQREATYEKDYGKSKAISELVDAMSVQDSKLNSVGDVVDKIYRCKGEKTL